MASITGTSGADTLVGGAGDDTFEGGSGEDIARLPGKLEDFRFGHADGYLVVTDTNPTDGDQGTDRLRAIEILRFDDGDRRLADGGEMRVNDTTLSAQTDAAGAGLHDGGYVLAWASFGQDGDGWGVYARRIGADGASAGEEFQVNTETADWQYQPAVAALAGGGFVVVWSSYAQDGNDIGVFAQVFDAAGTARGGEFQVNTTSNETQWRPAVAGLEDGGFVVCWQSYEQDGDVFGIFARRFDANGEASSGEIRLNQETTGSQTEPDVAALPDGGFIAAWSSFGQDGDGDGVYARRFDASGAARGDEFRVNAGTDGSQSEPAIAVGADGRVAIAWSAYVEDQSGYDVFATLYRADGSSFERQLNLSLAESQYEPSIAWLDGERLLATWTSFNQDQDAEGVFASVLFGESTEVQEIRVNTQEQRAQYDPVVIASGNGTALVAWTSIGQDGPDSAGVFVQRLDGTTKILPVLHGTLAGEHFDLGGSGALRAAGGGGNDVYVLGDSGDEVIESPAGGRDRIEASFAAELDQYDGIEDLRLLGTADLRGSGNAADNRLWGNAGRNALAGYDGADALDGGPGRDTLAGGNGADTLAGGLDEDTLAGGYGNDTYVLAAGDADDSVVEQAGEGIDTLLSALVRTRLPAQVERLVLAGSSALDGIGNTLPNLISGSAIGNLLDGGAGADTLVGGRGDDIYRVGAAGDRVIENIGEGIDTVVSRVSFTLGAHVEQLKLAGTAAIDGTGNFLANVLEGNRAANALDGGIGADVLIGKAGDDSYRVDQSADTVIEEAGGGVDRVIASASFALPEHVEVLSFVDPDGGTRDFSGTGNGGDNLLQGAAGNDALNGLAGDDTLAGFAGDDTLAGGSGTDSLLGGPGDDVFGVDSAVDVVIEYAGEGNDLVESSASYVLPDFVERLRLLGDADLEGSGNALANLLDGNRGNNRLAGGEGDDTLDGGDAGVDTLEGGSGDDLYYVDDANDEVVEGDGIAAAARTAAVLPAGDARPQPDAGTGGGIDTVIAQVSYTLRSNVENLRLDGTRDLDGTGNALDNVLAGNDGANRLDGKDGNDVLDGAAGNDTLDAGNGNDTVGGGSGDDVLAGGGGNDSLLGGAGEDTLSGGTGVNRLAGEAGGDVFLFDTAPDAANRTTVIDFVRGLDELHLDDDVFSAFDAGQSDALPATAFRSGAGISAAADADDRIIYNTGSGALYYDADGTGTARPAVLFAVLGTTTHPLLGAADFVIVG